MRVTEWKRMMAAMACLACCGIAIEAGAQDGQVLVEGDNVLVESPFEHSLNRVVRTYVHAIEDEQKPPLPTSDYWIGVVMATPWLPEQTKAQLGLDHGLMVQEAMEGSPAAKGGLKQYDILLKAGETPLKEPADLIKAVDAANESTLSLTVFRGGKEQTIDITPVKREEVKPQATARLTADEIKLHGTVPELTVEIQKLEQALNQLKAKAGEQGAEIVFARPAIVTQQWDKLYVARPDFPKDLRVQIQKEGNQPTKILVKRGEKEWQTTDDKLDALPREERTYVLRILRHGPDPSRRIFVPQADGYGAPDGSSGAIAAPNMIVRPDGKVRGRIEVRTAPWPPNAPAPPKAPRAAVPPSAPTAPSAPIAPTATDDQPDNSGQASSEALLKEVLKKLDENRDESVKELERQVKELRKELDQLRAEKEE